METAEYNFEDFNERYAADKSVYAKFYTMPFKDEAASAAEGRPIFKDREYIEIRAAGNQNNIINRPATDMDRQRFPRHYEAFKAGQSEQMFGTPLSEVTWLTKSQVEELAYVRVTTLEALAEVNDDVCARMAGLRDLKNRAAKFLEVSKDNAKFTELEAENTKLKEEVSALSAQLKEVVDQLKKLNEKGSK